jgi:DNA-binding NarL/FixJ family response regulator
MLHFLSSMLHFGHLLIGLLNNILSLDIASSSMKLMEATKNIVLIDDHIIVSNALKELIEKLGPYKISHQFDKGQEFIATFPQVPKPDLLILDVSMPGMSGDEVVEKMNSIGIKIPVLILTSIDDDEMVIKLFRLGVRGYLMKNCAATELKNAMNEIFKSGYYHNEFYTSSLKTSINAKKKSVLNEKVKDYRLFRVAESAGKINIKLSDILYMKAQQKGRQIKHVILKNGLRYNFMDCSFTELLKASSSLLRVNKSELISLEVFEKIDGDFITLKSIHENGKPKQVTLNRWYKKDFLARLSLKS